MNEPEITARQPELAPQELHPGEASGKSDFFISYNQMDKAWAEWLAWTLEEAHFTTILQAWDCEEGMDFFDYMTQALTNSTKTIAILSEDYLGSPHCMEEFKASYAEDPSGQARRLLLLRARVCTPPILRTRVYGDLFGMTESDARDAVFKIFGRKPEVATAAPTAPWSKTGLRRKPGSPPAFPGGVDTGPTNDDESKPPDPDEEVHTRDLVSRLLNACGLLFSVAAVFVAIAYFLGSKAFQVKQEYAYWDRMFNWTGNPEYESEFGFGPGLLIEIARTMVLLLIALIVMPMFAFRDAARRLIRETPARRLLGLRGVPSGGGMALDVRGGFLILIFFCVVSLYTVGLHHTFQGPSQLWKTQGFRDGSRPNPVLEPRVGDWQYWKRCLVPYLFYSVYSLVNYLGGVTLILTFSIYAGITDLVWMSRWTSEFKRDCAQGNGSPMVLHRRFEKRFLARFGEVLERYYALAVFLLMAFAFRFWLDRINLSPSAYEFELYAFTVATVLVIVAYMVSTVFYRSALESAASQAQSPDVFRQHHRMKDYYAQSIQNSVCLPVSLVLLVSIVIYFVWDLSARLFTKA
jgi:hypothetical protein